ncbi:MAG TPA: hypothetical protein VGI96_34965 [Streptosporangiaceae bacterium]
MTSCPAIHARASGPSTAGGNSAASRENSRSSSIRPVDSASYRAPWPRVNSGSRNICTSDVTA